MKFRKGNSWFGQLFWRNPKIKEHSHPTLVPYSEVNAPWHVCNLKCATKNNGVLILYEPLAGWITFKKFSKIPGGLQILLGNKEVQYIVFSFAHGGPRSIFMTIIEHRLKGRSPLIPPGLRQPWFSQNHLSCLLNYGFVWQGFWH